MSTSYVCQYEGCETHLSVWSIRALNTMCRLHEEHDPCKDLSIPVCDVCDSARFMRPVGIAVCGTMPTWSCGKCQRIAQKRAGSRAFTEVPYGHIDLTLMLDTPESRAQFAAFDAGKRKTAKSLHYCMHPEDGYRLTVLERPREATGGPSL